MAVPRYLFESVNITLYSFKDSHRAYSVIKITFVSQSLGAFRPALQSCTSSTLLPHTSKIASSHATLSATFIFKQTLRECLNLNQIKHYEA